MSSIEPLVPLERGNRERGSERARALRFAGLMGAILVGLSLLSVHRHHGATAVSKALLGAAAFLAVLALVLPSAALAVRRGWMWLGGLLGKINSTILLTVVYVALFTPIAVAMRLFGRGAFRTRGGSAFVRREARDERHFEHPY